MAKQTLILAEALDDTDETAWRDLPHNAKDVELLIEAADASDLDTVFEIQDAFGSAYPYHEATFAAAGKQIVPLGNLPHAKVRQINPRVDAGEINASLSFNT